jgi:hypothetical protein
MPTHPLPMFLYHSSGFLTDTLRPGVFYTGEIVRWDKVESNEYLYATPFMDKCINLGIASAVEKKYLLNEFHTSENEMVLEFVLDKESLLMNYRQLILLPVYLYKIQPTAADNWEPVVNESTDPGSEWKTKNAITKFIKKERVKVKQWLDERTVIIRHPRTRTIEKRPNGNVQTFRS